MWLVFNTHLFAPCNSTCKSQKPHLSPTHVRHPADVIPGAISHPRRPTRPRAGCSTPGGCSSTKGRLVGASSTRRRPADRRLADEGVSRQGRGGVQCAVAAAALVTEAVSTGVQSVVGACCSAHAGAAGAGAFAQDRLDVCVPQVTLQVCKVTGQQRKDSKKRQR